MRAGGATGVAIEPVAGELSRSLRSATQGACVCRRASMAVARSRRLGIAAHEAGHAIQDASHYPGLVVRNLIVPMASIGSMLFWVPCHGRARARDDEAGRARDYSLFADGGLSARQSAVEFNASRRGRQILQSTGLIGPDEEQVVAKVLNAAAWTYVAATLTSVMTLLFYLFQAGMLGGRRRRD